jgi:hypothetical protein
MERPKAGLGSTRDAKKQDQKVLTMPTQSDWETVLITMSTESMGPTARGHTGARSPGGPREKLSGMILLLILFLLGPVGFRLVGLIEIKAIVSDISCLPSNDIQLLGNGLATDVLF